MDHNFVEMNVLYDHDMRFIGETNDGHRFGIEPCKCLGGSGNSASPFDYLLGSLGACTGLRVLLDITEKGVKPDSLRVSIKGIRRENPPTIIEKMHLTYYLSGDLDEQTVKNAINEAMTRMCPVAAMIGKASELTWECQIS